jgi:hypothetical protein
MSRCDELKYLITLGYVWCVRVGPWGFTEGKGRIQAKQAEALAVCSLQWTGIFTPENFGLGVHELRI